MGASANKHTGWTKVWDGGELGQEMAILIVAGSAGRTHGTLESTRAPHRCGEENHLRAGCQLSVTRAGRSTARSPRRPMTAKLAAATSLPPSRDGPSLARRPQSLTTWPWVAELEKGRPSVVPGVVRRISPSHLTIPGHCAAVPHPQRG